MTTAKLTTSCICTGGSKSPHAALTTSPRSRVRVRALLAWSGATSTNNPICHPIRWPGSWHRKKEPRLCSTVAVEPDVEIALAAAVAALPAPPTETRQGRTVEDWMTFLDGRYEGSDRRMAVRRFAGLQIRYQDPLIAESATRCFNEARCFPPFPNDEIRRIVEDIAEAHADELKKGRR